MIAAALTDPRVEIAHLHKQLNGRIVLAMPNVEQLGEEIASLAAHLDAATHRLLECLRQFDAASGWHDQGAISCAHWLAWRTGLDTATAREKVRVARALGGLPAIDEALRQARLSYAKVRALTRVATPENEARLLALALEATGAQLERLCRGYRTAQAADKAPAPEERSVRQRVLSGGMVKLELVLSPDEADMILRAIDRAREVHAEPAPTDPPEDVSAEAPTPDPGDVSAETSWPSRADGAVALAESFLAGNPASGTGGDRFQVVVHLDQDVLGPDGALAGTLEDGTHVSAETLRRVACDCGLVAAGADGGELTIGRRARTIPPAIRRALMLRDRGCAFPGCTHTRFLHGHHIRHWLHGGETSVDNLALLCTVHHHLVHEGGWTIAHGVDGRLVFTSPVGRGLPHVPSREQVDNIVTWLGEWADAHGVEPGPDTNMPWWDGTTPDYDIAVGALLELWDIPKAS
jgi:hypothetical protein